MPFTVPRGPIDPGNAASTAQFIEPSGIGGEVAKFGRSINQLGQGIVNEKLDREASRASIDMTRDLGDLRLELEQLNDPDQIDAQWGPRSAEIKARILEGVDNRIHERVGLAFDQLEVSHGQALGRAAVAARKTQSAANWLTYSQELARQASTADYQTRQKMLGQADDWIDRELAAGRITPLDAAQMRVGVRDNADEAAAIAMVDADPEGFLEKADAGEFDGMQATAIARYSRLARSNIATREKAAETEAERLAREETVRVGKRLTEIEKGFGHPNYVMPAADLQFLETDGAKQHEDYAKVMAAKAAYEKYPDLKRRSPAQIQELLTEAQKSPRSPTAEFLEDLYKQAKSGWSNDPVTYAQEIGFGVPDLPQFNPADPTDFERGLKTRLAWGRTRTKEGYTTTTHVFSDREKEELANYLKPDADPGQRLAFLKAIVGATGGLPKDVAADLKLGDVPAHVAGILSANGGEQTAMALLRGEKKIEDKTVNLPEARYQRQLFDQFTGGIFEDQPEIKRQLLAATGALFADEAKGVDPEALGGVTFLSDDAALETYSAAVQRALGGSQDADGNYTVGGVQELSTGWTALPPGLGRDQTDRAFDAIENQLRGGVKTPQGWSYVENQEDPMRAFRQANPDGQAPDLGANARERWRQVEIQAIGNDRYRMIWRDPRTGRPFQILTDDQSKPFEFSLSKLVEGAAK